MDLPKEELEDVIHKVERVLRKVDYQSVPPLMYQLLLVAHSHLPGRVLQVVINYFNKQDLKVGSYQARDDATDITTADLMDEETIGEETLIVVCLYIYYFFMHTSFICLYIYVSPDMLFGEINLSIDVTRPLRRAQGDVLQ